MTHLQGRLVDAVDTQLYVVEVGPSDGYPVLVLHGGPGDDHHEFADYLDPLGDRGYRLLLVDQRGQGQSGPSEPNTWTLEKMAEDPLSLARSLGLDRFAILGHSYGAFVALQNAVDFPGMASQTIVSSGIPSARFLDVVEKNLAQFEPAELREQVKASWDREPFVETQEDFEQLMNDQWPFHFADPRDPRAADYARRRAGAVYSPQILRVFAAQDYGGIEVEDRLGEIPQPVLVLAGRHDRTCPVEASELMAAKIPTAELVVFEQSGHMTFVEEPERFIDAVDNFLRRRS
jgi:proline-specific peptidase